ncbi:ATP-binding cassette domain-containing protein [Pseudoalteromonas sp. MMG013]|uniref:ABC transporter ATP-binding protein n=1 Tax=Pseudoalteromonas sp. MMG013 TaxID=2822687 RepID=UPI001B3872DF|nr:ATP-binding cassette domain-containing protein [Pseudoalteromonas sp. MMG013]MBQ4864752.1 ATP-binding cassette domain-containing protein [Pseudoalteromonas sp. MMG013]
MIEVANLTKYFGKKCIFENYNNTFNAQKLCVEGQNGLGKTTLFTIIAGLDSFYSGHITLNGQQHAHLQSCVSLASDKIVFPEYLTAQQILTMTASSWQCTLPQEFITDLCFDAFLHTQVEDLSSGNLKKLQLINAVMRNTPYLILDEPSAALDKRGLDVVLEWICAYEGQVIISNHEPQPFLDIGFDSQPLKKV